MRAVYYLLILQCIISNLIDIYFLNIDDRIAFVPKHYCYCVSHVGIYSIENRSSGEREAVPGQCERVPAGAERGAVGWLRECVVRLSAQCAQSRRGRPRVAHCVHHCGRVDQRRAERLLAGFFCLPAALTTPPARSLCAGGCRSAHRRRASNRWCSGIINKYNFHLFLYISCTYLLKLMMFTLHMKLCLVNGWETFKLNDCRH